MGKRITGAAAIVLCAFIILVACSCMCAANDPLKGNIKVFSGSPDEALDKSALPPAGQPLISAPSQPSAPVERQITVTKTNSEFTIGLPAGYSEEREITASRLVDIWFKYITPDMSLEVNGQQVQIPERRSTSKLGLTQGVTHLTYKLKNTSANYLSYSLMIMPVNLADQVPVTTKEKWIAP